MARRKATAKVQVPVRMPEALRAQLERSAKARATSLNAEIVHRLTDSFFREEITQAVQSAVRAVLITPYGPVPVREDKK